MVERELREVALLALSHYNGTSNPLFGISMLTIGEKLSFIVLALVCGYFAWTGFRRVFKAIARGKAENRFEHLSGRLWKAIWIVVTQQSLFKTRPVASTIVGSPRG